MDLISLADAATLTGLSEKALLGLAARNDREDPVVVDLDENGRPVFANDWRLERLAVPATAMPRIGDTGGLINRTKVEGSSPSRGATADEVGESHGA